MRDYQIDTLPYRPILRIEPISPERLPRIAEEGLKLLEANGYDAKDREHVTQHLFGDGEKPPRVVALLVASQADHGTPVCRAASDQRPPCLAPANVEFEIRCAPDEDGRGGCMKQS